MCLTAPLDACPVPDPGPPPRAPVLPSVELDRLRAAVEQLRATLSTVVDRHEAVLDEAVGPDRFVGVTADGFRRELVGQLRRIRALQAQLAQDLGEVDDLSAELRSRQARHDAERHEWQRARARFLADGWRSEHPTTGGPLRFHDGPGPTHRHPPELAAPGTRR
jgi:hypothetical protein